MLGTPLQSVQVAQVLASCGRDIEVDVGTYGYDSERIDGRMTLEIVPFYVQHIHSRAYFRVLVNITRISPEIRIIN
jgi:hypothetical protein